MLVLAGAGLLIYDKRHQLFDRDPEVEDDIPVVRHNRFEEVLLAWGGLMLVVLNLLYQVWRA